MRRQGTRFQEAGTAKLPLEIHAFYSTILSSRNRAKLSKRRDRATRYPTINRGAERGPRRKNHP